jgi:histone acetyltransferase (RNA polymerase elongator complex component)
VSRNLALKSLEKFNGNMEKAIEYTLVNINDLKKQEAEEKEAEIKNSIADPELKKNETFISNEDQTMKFVSHILQLTFTHLDYFIDQSNIVNELFKNGKG